MGSLLALNVATLTGSDRAMNLALLLEVIWTNCFLLSVSARKKKDLIRGGIGNTWGHNFYMGTQNR